MSTDVWALASDPPWFLCASCTFRTTDLDEAREHVLTDHRTDGRGTRS